LWKRYRQKFDSCQDAAYEQKGFHRRRRNPAYPEKGRTRAAQDPSKPMDIVKKHSRNQEIVANVSPAQERNCFRGPPPPEKGLRLVHIHGYQFSHGNHLSLFVALIELRFKWPRRHVLNVSPINHELYKVVIEAELFDYL